MTCFHSGPWRAKTPPADPTGPALADPQPGLPPSRASCGRWPGDSGADKPVGPGARGPGRGSESAPAQRLREWLLEVSRELLVPDSDSGGPAHLGDPTRRMSGLEEGGPFQVRRNSLPGGRRNSVLGPRRRVARGRVGPAGWEGLATGGGGEDGGRRRASAAGSEAWETVSADSAAEAEATPPRTAQERFEYFRGKVARCQVPARAPGLSVQHGACAARGRFY